MNITTSLLYLLLLYAVLDQDNKLSVTTGLVIAFVILLCNCYRRNACCSNGVTSSSNNIFTTLNGF